MTNNSLPAPMREVITQLQDQAARIKKLEQGAGTTQLQSRSLQNSTLNIYGDDGNVVQVIGVQDDGTVGVSTLAGPTPPAPSAPTATAATLSLSVSWDGYMSAGDDGNAQALPGDFSHVEVHVSETSGFTPDDTTLTGTLSQAGQLTVTPLETNPQYLSLVTVSAAGVSSAPSVQAGPVTPLQVVATDVADGIVTTLKLADDAVTQAKVATGAIGSNELINGAVGAAQIASDAVTASAIAVGAVGSSELAVGAVTTGKLAAGAVTANELAANSVIAGKILAGTIGATELAANSVVAGKIAASSIQAGSFAAGSIAAGDIASNTITAAQIAASTITTTQIAANTIAAGNIAAGAVTASKLDANAINGKTITGSLIQTSATAPRIALDSVSDTILVYSSTGALIASVAAQAGTDGLGHSYPAGVSSTSGVVSQSLILLYDGTPTTGNLIASVAAAAGTDSFGNAYFRGTSSYDPTGAYSFLTGGQLISGQRESTSFPFGPVNGGVSVLSQSRGLSFISPSNASYPYAASAAMNAGYTLTQGAISYPNFEIICDGWIDGAWRASSNQIPETWHQVGASGQPAFSANWLSSTDMGSGLTGLTPLRFRKDAQDNCIIQGGFKASATMPGATVFQLPAAYHPILNSPPLDVTIRTSGGTVTKGSLIVSTSGNLLVNSAVGSSSIISATYYVNGSFPLGNLT